MSDYLIPFEPYAEASFTEKRSKFTGRLWRVESTEEALAHIKETRENFWDATHHCYAYILRDGNQMRYADDGEPQGTAGMPILEVLRHEGLTDTLCVVTRYFGGTLLGTGGLVRAYTEGVKAAIAAAGVQRMSLYDVLVLSCPYALLGAVQQVLPQYSGVVQDIDYGVEVKLTVTRPAGKPVDLNAALAEISAGRLTFECTDTRFMGRREK